MDNQFLDSVKGKHTVGCVDLEQSYTKEESRLVSKILESHSYVQVLDLDWGYSPKELKNAYTKLSEKVHPNNNKAPGAEEAFKKVKETYEYLRNIDACLCLGLLLLILPLFLFAFIIVRPNRSPPYLLNLDNTDNYGSSIMTKEYGINFYVRSLVEFDEKYPVGTSARAAIENKVTNDYIKMVQDYCNDDLNGIRDAENFQLQRVTSFKPLEHIFEA